MYPVLFYRYGPLILCHFMSAQILSVTQSSLQFPLWSCSQFHQPSSSCLPWKFLNKRADNSNPQTLGLLCLHLHSWILWKFTGQSVVNWLTSNKTELILKGSKAFERRGSEIQNPRNTGRGRILKSLRQKPRRSCVCLQEEIKVWNWDLGNQTFGRCKWTELWWSIPKHKHCLGEYPGEKV